MDPVIHDGIVASAGEELSPAIKVHPFRNSCLLTRTGDRGKAREWLDGRFGSWRIYRKGRSALNAALSCYGLQPDDTVTILTTSGNFYISHCVTSEIEKFCRWSRELTPSTRLILFNHEFGYPRRDMREVAAYGLPIIEDCAHTFFDTDPEIGKYADFVVYSFPKAFPMQLGGMLRLCRPGLVPGAEADSEAEAYVLDHLSQHIGRTGEYAQKRRSNFALYREKLAGLGIRPYFDDADAVPGVFLFRWEPGLDYPGLKSFMYENGVECSVFYGDDAFFLPCHQYLGDDGIEYIVRLLKLWRNR